MTLTTLFSTLLVFLGIAIVARTIDAGGGVTSIGIFIGLLFVAAGIGRLFVERRT